MSWALYRRDSHRMWSDDAKNRPFLINKTCEEFYPRLWAKHTKAVFPFASGHEHEISVHDLSAEELLTASAEVLEILRGLP